MHSFFFHISKFKIVNRNSLTVLLITPAANNIDFTFILLSSLYVLQNILINKVN